MLPGDDAVGVARHMSSDTASAITRPGPALSSASEVSLCTAARS